MEFYDKNGWPLKCGDRVEYQSQTEHFTGSIGILYEGAPMIASFLKIMRDDTHEPYKVFITNNNRIKKIHETVHNEQ